MSYIDRDFNIYKDTCDIRIKGPIFECDELIAPVIRELNLKGYRTVFCCSGHVNDDIYYCEDIGSTNNAGCYIALYDQISTLIVKGFTLPKGFKFEIPEWDLEECGYQTIIRRKFRFGTPRFIQMLNISKQIYKWAIELPDASMVNGLAQDGMQRLLEYA